MTSVTEPVVRLQDISVIRDQRALLLDNRPGTTLGCTRRQRFGQDHASARRFHDVAPDHGFGSGFGRNVGPHRCASTADTDWYG